MKLKYSKLRNFKIITGQHFLELQGIIGSASDDKKLDAMETMTIGLYLLDTHHDVVEAKKEYTRLNNKDNADEYYDIVDNVDLEELVADVLG